MAIGSCPPNTPPVHGVVVFDFSEWAASFPEFSGIAPAKAQAAFNSSTLQLNNGCRGLIRDAVKRQTLLYLLTAHITFLRYGANDGTAAGTIPAPGIVGRVNSAHEGSVSATASYSDNIPQAMAYYVQTKWGAEYWQATSQYRTMRYIPPPAQCCGGCGGMVGTCGCGIGLGPSGTGFPGFNGGTC